MHNSGFQFELLHVDRHCGARLGRLTTPRGVIDLPAFMPVGTAATVKGVTFDLVEQTGAQIVLANTYHLALRPGGEVVEQLGGLHQFSGWNRPILTDSGGFQLFSLASRVRINEQGATFQSHIDGRTLELAPEDSVRIQEQLGSDIAMVLDHLVQLPASRSVIEDAADRTVRWAERCQKAHQRSDQIQFAIVQGGLDAGLRKKNAADLVQLKFPGYAIGGLSVGERPAEMYEAVETTTPCLPVDCPRYLMGVGRPEDILASIRRGVDMFDCVMPTRNGRNAWAFTDDGPVKLRNSRYRTDPLPVQADVVSPWSHLSRAYLRHLFMAGEMLGPTLLSLHNLAYYQRMTRQAREAIANDAFLDYYGERMAGWNRGKGDPPDESVTAVT